MRGVVFRSELYRNTLLFFKCEQTNVWVLSEEVRWLSAVYEQKTPGERWCMGEWIEGSVRALPAVVPPDLLGAPIMVLEGQQQLFEKLLLSRCFGEESF